MTEKLKWLTPRDPVSVDRQLLQWDLYPRKEFIMTSYELIGLLIGFGILAASAVMLTAVLNALDEGTHGCTRDLKIDLEPWCEWETGTCKSCKKVKKIHIGYGECESCVFYGTDED